VSKAAKGFAAAFDPDGQWLTVAAQPIGEVTELNHNATASSNSAACSTGEWSMGRTRATDGQTGAPSRAMPRRLPLPSVPVSPARPLNSVVKAFSTSRRGCQAHHARTIN
jgi:hypothetical protein